MLFSPPVPADVQVDDPSMTLADVCGASCGLEHGGCAGSSGEQNGEIFCEEGALAKDQRGCEAASCCEWCGTLSTFRSRIASGY